MILRHFRAVCSTGRWCLPNNLRNASEWSDTSTLTLRTLIHFFRRYICFMEIASCWNIIYIPLPRSMEIYDICVLFTWVYRSLIYRIFFSWLFELIVDVFVDIPGDPSYERDWWRVTPFESPRPKAPLRCTRLWLAGLQDEFHEAKDWLVCGSQVANIYGSQRGPIPVVGRVML